MIFLLQGQYRNPHFARTRVAVMIAPSGMNRKNKNAPATQQAHKKSMGTTTATALTIARNVTVSNVEYRGRAPEVAAIP
jgi:hypothetical protein